MATIRNFHEKLEQDLQRVTAEVAKRHERAPEVSSRETVKQAIIAAVPPPLPTPTPAKEDPLPSTPTTDANLPAYLSAESPEVKAEVARLVTLALHDGIAVAVADAAKKSPFVLDALHDALTDKLLPELERRGILK